MATPLHHDRNDAQRRAGSTWTDQYKVLSTMHFTTIVDDADGSIVAPEGKGGQMIVVSGQGERNREEIVAYGGEGELLEFVSTSGLHGATGTPKGLLRLSANGRGDTAQLRGSPAFKTGEYVDPICRFLLSATGVTEVHRETPNGAAKRGDIQPGDGVPELLGVDRCAVVRALATAEALYARNKFDARSYLQLHTTPASGGSGSDQSTKKRKRKQ